MSQQQQFEQTVTAQHHMLTLGLEEAAMAYGQAYENGCSALSCGVPVEFQLQLNRIESAAKEELVQAALDYWRSTYDGATE